MTKYIQSKTNLIKKKYLSEQLINTKRAKVHLQSSKFKFSLKIHLILDLKIMLSIKYSHYCSKICLSFIFFK